MRDLVIISLSVRFFRCFSWCVLFLVLIGLWVSIVWICVTGIIGGSRSSWIFIFTTSE